MRLHRFAIAVALATWVLTIFGGLVSTTESGLACPDWPLCEGKFIPRMVDGKQYEHTHRLVASFVGAMMFGLCALIIKYRRKDKGLLWLGIAGAVLVTAQALLGALTVILKLPWYVSSTHFGTAMAFFAVAITLAFLTRQRLSGTPVSSEEARLGRPVVWVAGVLYAQLVVGAMMRHLRGGLACGYDILTCQGQVWPLDGHLGMQVHMAHRLIGTLAGIAVLALTVWLSRQASASRTAKWVAASLSVGVLAQITLGILTILSSRELITMTVHSSLGIALFGGAVALKWVVAPSRAPATAVVPREAQRAAMTPAVVS